MTNQQLIITVLLMMAGTMLTRFGVFMIFPAGRTPPRFVNYLGTVLPTAAIALIVVYALKDVSVLAWPYGLPELISVGVIILIHRRFRQTILSIAVGTLLYMFLVQFVFL